MSLSSALSGGAFIVRSKMTLKDRMEEIMEAKGWTQADMARFAKVDRSAVNQWLSGDVKTIKSQTAVNLHRASGFSLQWIATGEGIKTAGKAFTVVPGTKPQPVDLDLLRDSIAGVESFLKDRRLSAPPPKKAQLVALIYENALSTGRVDAGVVERILRLVS